LGALGLFFLAILDSSPLPTFGGPDILIAILAASHRNPWYEYAAVTTVGSVIGAGLTFHLARKAGSAYLNSKFGHGKVPSLLKLFEKWGTGTLVASTAIPFPFPTSMFFAAAGASNYRVGKFLAIVATCRAARYAAIAIVADRYGASLRAHAPASDTILGVVIVVHSGDFRFDRRGNSDQQATRNCIGSLNDALCKIEKLSGTSTPRRRRQQSAGSGKSVAHTARTCRAEPAIEGFSQSHSASRRF
jgi:membrane protein YqaA with SNARE-associated domain